MFSKQNNSQKEQQLRQVAADGNLEVVKNLIEKEHVSVDAVGAKSNKSALHWAAEKGHEDIVNFLLKCGASLISDSDGNTAFDLASSLKIKEILTRHFKVIRSNLDPKNIESKDSTIDYGFDIPGEVAQRIFHCDTKLAELKILMKKYNLTGNSYLHGIPILLMVPVKDANWVKNGKVDYLLETCTNPNLTAHPIQINSYQNTPVHALLANENDVEAIAFMQKVKKRNLKIDTKVQDVLGRTILHLGALLRAHDFLEKCLENFGTEGIDIQDLDKMTPLHFAYLFGDKKTIDLLEKFGAKKDIQDARGMVAEKMLNLPLKEVKDVLRKFHIDPSRKTSSGKSLIEECNIARLELLKTQAQVTEVSSLRMGK